MNFFWHFAFWRFSKLNGELEGWFRCKRCRKPVFANVLDIHNKLCPKRAKVLTF